MNSNSKKIMALATAVFMMATVTACSSNNSSSSSSSVPVPPSSVSPSTTPESPSSTSGTNTDSEYDMMAQRYATAITGARDEEMNSAFDVFTHDPAYNMSNYRNNFADMKKEDGTAYTDAEMMESHDSARDMNLSLLGINAADVENYAISVSPMNTKAYGIAVVKPVAGKEDTVKAALENFVTTQQKNFETYLPDQYEIAKAGYVKTMEDGTLVMVVSENQDTVYESITKGLTATR